MAMPIGRPQPHRTELGQEQRNQEPDRDRDQHRNEGSHQGSVDRRQRAEFLGDGIPTLLDQEIEPEACSAGIEPISSDRITPLRITNTPMAAARVSTLKMASPRRSRSSALAREADVSQMPAHRHATQRKSRLASSQAAFRLSLLVLWRAQSRGLSAAAQVVLGGSA